MTAPNVIWVYSASCLSFDEGEWDQSEIPQCGHDWPHARYIHADAPELLALVEAAKAVNHDNIHGNGLEGFRKNRDRLRICLEQWEDLK